MSNYRIDRLDSAGGGITSEHAVCADDETACVHAGQGLAVGAEAQVWQGCRRVGTVFGSMSLWWPKPRFGLYN